MSYLNLEFLVHLYYVVTSISHFWVTCSFFVSEASAFSYFCYREESLILSRFNNPQQKIFISIRIVALMADASLNLLAWASVCLIVVFIAWVSNHYYLEWIVIWNRVISFKYGCRIYISCILTYEYSYCIISFSNRENTPVHLYHGGIVHRMLSYI